MGIPVTVTEEADAGEPVARLRVADGLSPLRPNGMLAEDLSLLRAASARSSDSAPGDPMEEVERHDRLTGVPAACNRGLLGEG